MTARGVVAVSGCAGACDANCQNHGHGIASLTVTTKRHHATADTSAPGSNRASYATRDVPVGGSSEGQVEGLVVQPEIPCRSGRADAAPAAASLDGLQSSHTPMRPDNHRQRNSRKRLRAVIRDFDLSRNVDERLGPEWLAHRFDESANAIRFVDYDRQTRASVPFLTDTYLPAKPFRAERRTEALAMAPATASIHFVFHSGFCCSTLFAQCFEQPGLASTFSEPMILNDVSGWRKRGAPPAVVGKVLDDALDLLARPFEGDQAALVKPSTIANGLASAMVRLRPDAKAVLLYAPLEDFITSIAKKGLDGRLWARELFMGMRREGLVDGLGFSDDQFFGQTDLQIAASAWLGQQRLFASLLSAFPDRVRSLDSKRFLDDPLRAVRAGADLFQLESEQSHLETAKAQTLARNSKDRKPFTRGSREADYRSARTAYGDEIEKVAAWTAAVAEAAHVSLTLANPLLKASTTPTA